MPKAIDPETLMDIDWSVHPPDVLEKVWKLCEGIPEQQTKTSPATFQKATIYRVTPPGQVVTHTKETPAHVTAVSVIEAHMTQDEIRKARRREKGPWGH